MLGWSCIESTYTPCHTSKGFSIISVSRSTSAERAIILGLETIYLAPREVSVTYQTWASGHGMVAHRRRLERPVASCSAAIFLNSVAGAVGSESCTLGVPSGVSLTRNVTVWAQKDSLGRSGSPFFAEPFDKAKVHHHELSIACHSTAVTCLLFCCASSGV